MRVVKALGIPQFRDHVKKMGAVTHRPRAISSRLIFEKVCSLYLRLLNVYLAVDVNRRRGGVFSALRKKLHVVTTSLLHACPYSRPYNRYPTPPTNSRGPAPLPYFLPPPPSTPPTITTGALGVGSVRSDPSVRTAIPRNTGSNTKERG